MIACRRRFGERGLIVALAFFIGAAGAGAAAALKMLVFLLEKSTDWLYRNPEYGALFFLTPLAGISLSFAVQRLFGDREPGRNMYNQHIVSIERQR